MFLVPTASVKVLALVLKPGVEILVLNLRPDVTVLIDCWVKVLRATQQNR